MVTNSYKIVTTSDSVSVFEVYQSQRCPLLDGLIDELIIDKR